MADTLTSAEQLLARAHLLGCQTTGDISGMLVHRRLRLPELREGVKRLEEARQILEQLIAKAEGTAQASPSTSSN